MYNVLRQMIDKTTLFQTRLRNYYSMHVLSKRKTLSDTMK